MVAKEELELTSTEYWTALLLEFVDLFQASVMAHALEEQELLVSWISTGMLGGVLRSTKSPAADQAETLLVVIESRACTRQNQVPLGKLTDQLVPEIHPEE